MKSPFFFGAFMLQALLSHVLAQDIRSLFLFKDVMKSNTTALQTSGFNTLIMFGVGVRSNGDIMYYSNTPGSSDVLIASNGAYTGGDALAAKVRSFKTSPNTGINRVEICMNSQNIQSLMASPGPGATTPLYRNFAALKAAWALDAVNNNDESLYHLASTVSFAKMLGGMGYKYSMSPYDPRVISFYSGLVAQVNQGSGSDGPLLDRAYLQCYDGGANNNPPGWQQALGMKVVPLLWVVNDSKPGFGVTVAQARARFAGWQQQGGGLAGGGYWNDYDIEKMGLSYGEYGRVLREVFPS